jgi:hypothetical protein
VMDVFGWDFVYVMRSDNGGPRPRANQLATPGSGQGF